jgi:hypothetical protein
MEKGKFASLFGIDRSRRGVETASLMKSTTNFWVNHNIRLVRVPNNNGVAMKLRS